MVIWGQMFGGQKCPHTDDEMDILDFVFRVP